jgi:hypothetical protein
MKRATLKEEFHGEPDMAQEGLDVAEQGPDEVTVEITRGTLTLRVPLNVPDDQVLNKEYLGQFLQFVLELEDGSELTVIMNEDRDGVDVRRETRAQIAHERKTESRLEAEKSPRAEEG